jgi:hypothetical protein
MCPDGALLHADHYDHMLSEQAFQGGWRGVDEYQTDCGHISRIVRGLHPREEPEPTLIAMLNKTGDIARTESQSGLWRLECVCCKPLRNQYNSLERKKETRK